MCNTEFLCSIVRNLHCVLHGSVERHVCMVRVIRFSRTCDGFVSFDCPGCPEPCTIGLPDDLLAMIDTEQRLSSQMFELFDVLAQLDVEHVVASITGEPDLSVVLGCLHCEFETTYHAFGVYLDYVPYPDDIKPSLSNGFASLSGYGRHWVHFKCLRCDTQNRRVARQKVIMQLGGPIGPERRLAGQPTDPGLTVSDAVSNLEEVGGVRLEENDG